MRVRTRCVRLRNQVVVFAAKGHDPDFGFLAGHPADAVAVQSGTIDHIFGGEGSATGLDHHLAGPRRTNARTSVPVLRRAALSSQNLGVFFADRGVVGDARAGHQHAQQAAAVRLNFAQLFLLQQPQSGEAVGLSAIQQGVEARDLLGVGGDDDFAADFVRQVVVAAKFHHGGRALDAELRLSEIRACSKCRSE